MRQQSAIRTLIAVAWVLSVSLTLPASAADATGSEENVVPLSGPTELTDVTDSNQNDSSESGPAGVTGITGSDHVVAPDLGSDGDTVNVEAGQPEAGATVPSPVEPTEGPSGGDIPNTSPVESPEGSPEVSPEVVPEVVPDTPQIVLPDAPTEKTVAPTTPAEPPAQQTTKDYIVKNYDGIVKDLRRGAMSQPGKDLAALLSRLHVSVVNEYAVIKRIQALSVAYPDIDQFADHVTEVFGR